MGLAGAAAARPEVALGGAGGGGAGVRGWFAGLTVRVEGFTAAGEAGGGGAALLGAAPGLAGRVGRGGGIGAG